MIIFNLMAVLVIGLGAIIGYVLALPLLLFNINNDVFEIVAVSIGVIAATVIDSSMWKDGSKGGRLFYIPVYIWGTIIIAGGIIYGVYKVLVGIYYFVLNNWLLIGIGAGVIAIFAVISRAVSNSDMSENSKKQISGYLWLVIIIAFCALIGWNPIRSWVIPAPTPTPTMTPVPTSTPSPSRTPKPTNTRAPTRTPAPPTETPIPAECTYECAPLNITNNTGAVLKFSISGPGESSWSLPIGTTKLKVIPGRYTIVAKAQCGVDTDVATFEREYINYITYSC